VRALRCGLTDLCFATKKLITRNFKFARAKPRECYEERATREMERFEKMVHRIFRPFVVPEGALSRAIAFVESRHPAPLVKRLSGMSDDLATLLDSRLRVHEIMLAIPRLGCKWRIACSAFNQLASWLAPAKS